MVDIHGSNPSAGVGSNPTSLTIPTKRTASDRVRAFAVGDLHGCLEELESALAYVDSRTTPGSKYEVVFLGDYCDRGPDSKGVVDRLIAWSRGKRHAGVYVTFVAGNHDSAFSEAISDDPFDFQHWTESWGGRETVRSYTGNMYSTRAEFAASVPLEHRAFFSGLLSYREVAGCVFVHGGLEANKPLHEQSELTMQWTRKKEDWEWDHGALVVHGHTPVYSVVSTPTHVNLDTAACYGRKLTVGEFYAGRLVQTASFKRESR